MLRKRIMDCGRIIIAIFLSYCLVSWCYAFRPITSRKMPEKAHSLAGTYPEYPSIDYGSGPEAAIIKRGEYLAKVGDCIACHSNPEKGGKPFAGGLPIKTPFGKIYSPNITPDKKTGIGKWDAKDFYRALHHGKSPSGSNYFPVFPYVYFSNMTKEDVMALWAYFRKIPAVRNPNKDNDISFPFNVRFAQYIWKELYFYPYDEPIKFIPHRGKAWNRGNYLVNGPGHCSMCHTPMNSLGANKREYYLTGAFIDGYWAPNITYYGLSQASNRELMKVFREDALLQDAGKISGPMKEVNHDSLQHLSDEDIYAIATYLHSVKTARPYFIQSKQEISLARGKYVYQNACAACHQSGKLGAPLMKDGAAWYKLARSKGMTTLYRHTIDGINQMPERGNCPECSDEDIESAVNYIMHKALTMQQKRSLRLPKKHRKITQANGKAVYESQCSVCHDSGKLGAPMLGDKAVWRRIINKNMDVLIENKIKGSDRYPPKGGCKYCTNSEVIAAIKYMVNESKSKGDYSLW